MNHGAQIEHNSIIPETNDGRVERHRCCHRVADLPQPLITSHSQPPAASRLMPGPFPVTEVYVQHSQRSFASQHWQTCGISTSPSLTLATWTPGIIRT
jgi:hypothetical protein